MGDLFLPSERQMARISPFFPLSRGVPRVDDRRVVNGIVVMASKSSNRQRPGSFPQPRTGAAEQSGLPMKPDAGCSRGTRGRIVATAYRRSPATAP